MHFPAPTSAAAPQGSCTTLAATVSAATATAATLHPPRCCDLSKSVEVDASRADNPSPEFFLHHPLPLYSSLLNSDSLLFGHRHVATLHIQGIRVVRVRHHAKLLSIRTPSLSNIIPPACPDEVKLSISWPQTHWNEEK